MSFQASKSMSTITVSVCLESTLSLLNLCTLSHLSIRSWNSLPSSISARSHCFPVSVSISLHSLMNLMMASRLFFSLSFFRFPIKRIIKLNSAPGVRKDIPGYAQKQKTKPEYQRPK